mgnify:CR=1 FL=1
MWNLLFAKCICKVHHEQSLIEILFNETKFYSLVVFFGNKMISRHSYVLSLICISNPKLTGKILEILFFIKIYKFEKLFFCDNDYDQVFGIEKSKQSGFMVINITNF